MAEGPNPQPSDDECVKHSPVTALPPMPSRSLVDEVKPPINHWYCNWHPSAIEISQRGHLISIGHGESPIHPIRLLPLRQIRGANSDVSLRRPAISRVVAPEGGPTFRGASNAIRDRCPVKTRRASRHPQGWTSSLERRRAVSTRSPESIRLNRGRCQSDDESKVDSATRGRASAGEVASDHLRRAPRDRATLTGPVLSPLSLRRRDCLTLASPIEGHEVVPGTESHGQEPSEDGVIDPTRLMRPEVSQLSRVRL
jgi:hypothetical protein